jgi:hypothetical protein
LLAICEDSTQEKLPCCTALRTAWRLLQACNPVHHRLQTAACGDAALIWGRLLGVPLPRIVVVLLQITPRQISD